MTESCASGQLNLPNPQATHDLGVRLGKTLVAGTVLLLSGELGAGKTALVQALGEGLGIQDSLESPTFTLLNEYHDGRLPLYHLDLYRLTPAEVADLYLEGYWDGTEAPMGIMAIEWCDRLPYYPDRYLHLQLSHAPSEHPLSSRHLEWQAIGDIAPSLLEILRLDPDL